ncbi:MAG: hypothetical protein QW175_06240 [Candidatus Bathyarchaeia archaeon]
MVCNYYAFCQSIFDLYYIIRFASLIKNCWGKGEGCRIYAYLQQHLTRLRPIDGYYYDLIRVPHGHIPVPKVKLWSRLPLPIKEFRDERYYRCPSCGQPSFFKILFTCDECWKDNWRLLGYRKAERRDYFRQFWKRLEYLLLPVLVLTGKAWYVLASSRISVSVRFAQKLSKRDC